jgi:predicted Zn-dependent protease
MVVWTVGHFLQKHSGSRVGKTLMVVIVGVLMVSTFIQVSRWQNSVRLWAHTVNVTARSPISHMQFALAVQKAGGLEPAEELLRKGVSRWPNYAMLNANLGINRIKSHRFDEAIPHLRRAVKLEPDNGPIESLLGMALWKTGVYAEAEQFLRRGIKHDPAWVRSHYWLGRLQLDLGNSGAARTCFELALKVDRAYEPAKTWLGELTEP